MSSNNYNILIFSTNIKTKLQKKKIEKALNNNALIKNWSIDQSDEDYVLRVVCIALTSNDIISIANNLNFTCKELD